MNINVNRTVTGIDEIKIKLRLLSNRAKNPRPVFVILGSYFAAHNRKVFATNGAYNGSPWKPLSPDYHQWKIRTGKSPNTLVRTGKLRASYVSRPMGIEVYGKMRARYGSNVRYAHFHQSGTRHMPARRVMVVNKKVRMDVKQIVEDYISGNKTSIKKLI